jgi:hypothetical protein
MWRLKIFEDLKWIQKDQIKKIELKKEKKKSCITYHNSFKEENLFVAVS